MPKTKTAVEQPQPVVLPRVYMPNFRATSALEIACRKGSHVEIKNALKAATETWDPHKEFFRVGPNIYTVSGIIREISNHSHYGNEFVDELKRRYA